MHNANQYVKVINSEGLVRDLSTGAIINNNVSDYENYMKLKQQAKNRRDEITKQTDEINKIKSELTEIKQLLLSIIDKDNR